MSEGKNRYRITSGKNRYRITSGPGSWHQRRAGHFISSVMMLEGTKEELAFYLKNAFAPDDVVVVENLDLVPP